jgi:SAM-dependent methyltransferase
MNALGKCLAGRPKTAPQALSSSDHPVDQDDFFGALGFQRIHSLDVSSYENATFVYDLNRGPDYLPVNLIASYDVVFNGGTLEHCFDIARGLAAALSMAAHNGLFVSISPMNNYVDHGFYQFSPTLFFDFAQANRWSVIESACIRLTLEQGVPICCDVAPLAPGQHGTVGAFDSAAYLHYIVLRRESCSSVNVAPLQRYYQSVHNTPRGVHGDFLVPGFTPYRIE